MPCSYHCYHSHTLPASSHQHTLPLLLLLPTAAILLQVVLGVPYTHAIDMWSLGCILVELHTGDALFPASASFDHVCRMVGVLGMPPDELIARSPHACKAKFFERSWGRSSSISSMHDAQMQHDADDADSSEAQFQAQLPAQFRASGEHRLRRDLLLPWLQKQETEDDTAVSSLDQVQ
jgi:serine/threonine protein kinase